MRRSEKEIKDRAEIERIVRQAGVLRLAMVDGDRPYIVPMSFGYADGKIYCHAANEGMKIDILRRNRNVCFEIEVDVETVRANVSCDAGMKYRSVIGFGVATIGADDESKRRALDVICDQYGMEKQDYPDKALAGTTAIEILIESMTGKASGY